LRRVLKVARRGGFGKAEEAESPSYSADSWSPIPKSRSSTWSGRDAGFPSRSCPPGSRN